MSGFRLNSLFDNTSAIPPSNTGLSKYAQARLDNITSRAVQKHKNSLMVDGNPIFLWIRRPTGGLICTCQQRSQPTDATNQPNVFSTDPRQPIAYRTSLVKDDDVGYEIIHIRGYDDEGAAVPTNNPLLQQIQQASPNPNAPPIPDLGQNSLDAMTPLDVENSNADTETILAEDQRLALMLNEGGNGVWGGDKTPCGICYSTGRTQGYQLVNATRLLLDASGENVLALHGGTVQRNKFPAKFKVTTTAWVQWEVNIPAFTNGWLTMVVRDNLQPAENVRLDIFQNNEWVPLTLALLGSTDGTDRRGTIIRAIANNAVVPIGSTVEFTHAEIIYSTADPILAQCPPVTVSTNFEVLEPLIQTEFEVLAAVPDLSRESVFQDTKYKYLWKVLDVTPKTTSRGQVFAYSINARMVHRSEMAFAMAIILQPNLTVNFRGLELTEGGLVANDYPNTDQPLDINNVLNDLGFERTDGDTYFQIETPDGVQTNS